MVKFHGQVLLPGVENCGNVSVLLASFLGLMKGFVISHYLMLILVVDEKVKEVLCIILIQQSGSYDHPKMQN